MNGNEIWIWLIVGLVPYYIKRQQGKDEQTFEVRAIFWSLVICQRHRGQHQWIVRIPLIERLRK